MGYDPNEPRDGRGRWTSGGGYGPGQKLKGTHKSSEGSIADRKAALSKAQVADRWSKMNNTAKAALEASARFETKFTQGSRKSRGIATGAKPKNLHVATVSTPDGPRAIYELSKHAVAIQTAKSLDKDFRAERDKANKEAMKIALAKSQVPVTKYPSQKPKKR
ncbi:MAG TPA: hypothetical protein VHL10_01780 [Nitrososphaera sp.]|nr:hypothetical protein [Nitrososphaera sp.]